MFASFWVRFLGTADPEMDICAQGVYRGVLSQEQCLWEVERTMLGRGEAELQSSPKASAHPLVNSGVRLLETSQNEASGALYSSSGGAGCPQEGRCHQER